jgi:hypothetical protein
VSSLYLTVKSFSVSFCIALAPVYPAPNRSQTRHISRMVLR